MSKFSTAFSTTAQVACVDGIFDSTLSGYNFNFRSIWHYVSAVWAFSGAMDHGIAWLRAVYFPNGAMVDKNYR